MVAQCVLFIVKAYHQLSNYVCNCQNVCAIVKLRVRLSNCMSDHQIECAGQIACAIVKSLCYRQIACAIVKSRVDRQIVCATDESRMLSSNRKRDRQIPCAIVKSCA